MKKEKEINKPRNFVKKYADEFTKPSRFRDRKHDYERREKHRHRSEKHSTDDEASAKRKREVLSQEGENWRSDIDEYWNFDYGEELWDEDPSSSGEV